MRSSSANIGGVAGELVWRGGGMESVSGVLTDLCYYYKEYLLNLS